VEGRRGKFKGEGRREKGEVFSRIRISDLKELITSPPITSPPITSAPITSQEINQALKIMTT
jgi:hypothetical protein